MDSCCTCLARAEQCAPFSFGACGVVPKDPAVGFGSVFRSQNDLIRDLFGKQLYHYSHTQRSLFSCDTDLMLL